MSRAEPLLRPVEAAGAVLLLYCGAVALPWPAPTTASGWWWRHVAPPLVLLVGTVLASRQVALPWRGVARRGLVLQAVGALLLAVAASGALLHGEPVVLPPGPLTPRANLLFTLGWVGVVAPVIEELYFRGLLQVVLRASLGTAPAVVVAAVAFVAAHFSTEAVWLRLALGLTYGLLQVVSGSVWVAAAAHVGWNVAWPLTTVTLQGGYSLVIVGIAGLTVSVLGWRERTEREPCDESAKSGPGRAA